MATVTTGRRGTGSYVISSTAASSYPGRLRPPANRSTSSSRSFKRLRRLQEGSCQVRNAPGSVALLRRTERPTDLTGFRQEEGMADHAEALQRWSPAQVPGPDPHAPIQCTVELFGVARFVAHTREVSLTLPAGATFS